MKTIKIGTAIAVLMFTTAAFATPPGNNGGGNGGCGVGQTTNGCGATNNGGAGGAGGNAAAIAAQQQGQIQGQSQSSRNINRNTANGGRGGNGGQGGVGNGGNGGNQTQGQTVNVDNSGVGSNNGTGNGYGWNYPQFPVSSAVAPSFSVGDKCQYALSGGAQFIVVGASLGTVQMYEFCKSMMKADYFRAQGRPDMAKILECNDNEFRAAYKAAGTPCRQDVPASEQSRTPIVQVGQPTLASSGGPGSLNRGGVQCVNAAGAIVPVGQPGAVRCQ